MPNSAETPNFLKIEWVSPVPKVTKSKTKKKRRKISSTSDFLWELPEEKSGNVDIDQFWKHECLSFKQGNTTTWHFPWKLSCYCCWYCLSSGLQPPMNNLLQSTSSQKFKSVLISYLNNIKRRVKFNDGRVKNYDFGESP